MNNFLSLILKFLRRFFFLQTSFSQEGEDLVLKRLLEDKSVGFYIDIGAHHPCRFSNTYKFYLEGWKGINIEPMPGSKKKFDHLRPRDINLELGVAESEGLLTFIEFDEPALNTFSPTLSEERISKTSYRKKNEQKISVAPLKNILDKYLVENQKIDFMSIDVEGLDFEVLKSNDWNKFRPTILICEILDTSFSDLLSNEIVKFLQGNSYEIVGKTVNSVFFKNIRI